MRRDDLRRFYTELFIPHRKMKIKTRLSTFATLSQKMHEYRYPGVGAIVRMFWILDQKIGLGYFRFNPILK